MMDLQWIAPKGDGDLDGCRALRTTVFVGEQGIPEQVELDDRDADCTHVLIRLQGTVIATGRMLPEGRIGR
ncbi:MAG: GNAT family N-acetyltransferase, partial [Oceanococcaceae bacterium]